MGEANVVRGQAAFGLPTIDHFDIRVVVYATTTTITLLLPRQTSAGRIMDCSTAAEMPAMITCRVGLMLMAVQQWWESLRKGQLVRHTACQDQAQGILVAQHLGRSSHYRWWHIRRHLPHRYQEE
jgi:hypothetical protein